MSAELRLGPMLRYVSETEATIWVETTAPCTVTVLGHSTPTFEVGGHHYALVIVDDLEPDTVTPYEVRLDDTLRWPPADSPFPPSTIRTLGGDRPLRMLFGSCRAAAPHEPPYILTPDETGGDEVARGVDALRANGLRMLATDRDEWPDVVVMMGDQVYADDASPAAKRRVEARRDTDRIDLPPHVVADFEEYTWLYEESWRQDVERWVFSVVPTAMIFDDHDVIDDWNTSAAWVRDIRAEPWWHEHIVGAMMSYWVYQHLGNLSPREIAAEGLLADVLAAGSGPGDAEGVLRRWALESESMTPIPGGYQFSFHRRFGDVQLIVVDTRNGRVLAEGDRRMVDDDEWGRIVDLAWEPCRHLVIVTSLPVFAPGGIHAVQQWNEAVCGGAWGKLAARVGEKIRRAIDTEHWPAFDHSFRAFEKLLLTRGATDADPVAPETISVLGGDIHFSYAVELTARDGTRLASRMHQIVSSPIRHVLPRRERTVMRFTQSSAGRRIAELGQRLVRRTPSAMAWDLDVSPIFDNAMGLLTFDGDRARLTMERSLLVDGEERLEEFQHLEL